MKVFSLLSRVALILASACLALACSKLAASTGSNNDATAVATPVAAVTAPSPSQNPEDKMPRLRPEETKKLVDEGKAVIIDVRGTEAYKISHIKGSLDYPLTKVEAGDFSGLPKGKRIIAYCT
jgi:hypothetical protein